MEKHYFDDIGHLVRLLSVAFYGLQWALVSVPGEWKGEWKVGECRVDTWARILQKHGRLEFTDCEEGEIYDLTLNKLKKAWDSDSKDIAYAKAAFIREDEDSYDADTIIQCAIFGEIVYG